jgi:hypothetical protein
MSGPAAVVVAMFGLLISLLSGRRLLAPQPAGIVAIPHAVRGWLVVGVVMLLLGGGVITVLHPTRAEIEIAGGIFAFLIAGVLAKWLWDASLLTPFRLEGVKLMGALVITPLIALAAWNVLTQAKTLHTLLLCFSNGFFWQTIFSDLSKRGELQRLNNAGGGGGTGGQ